MTEASIRHSTDAVNIRMAESQCADEAMVMELAPQTAPRSDEQDSNSDRIVVHALLVILCISNMLLPIDWGFPCVSIGGLPFRWPLLLNIGILCWLLVSTHGKILHVTLHRYCLYQLPFICLLVINTAISTEFFTAANRTISNISAFSLNFIILYYFFTRGYRTIFVRIFCVTVAIAALIGVVEGMTSFRFPFYETWFAQFDPTYIPVSQGGFWRVVGPLGNPILYSVGILLPLAFVMEIPSRLWRLLLVLLLSFAAFLTLSKTIVLIGIPIAFFLMYRSKTARWIGAVVCGLVVVLLISKSLALDELELVTRWTSRLNNTESNTISFRVEAALSGLTVEKDIAPTLFGHGLMSSYHLASKIDVTMMTLDNTFVSIFYDAGLIGLFCYLAGFGMMLWDTRHFAGRSAHWVIIVGLLCTGFAFDNYFYYTFNFSAAASIASLYWMRQQTPSTEYTAI